MVLVYSAAGVAAVHTPPPHTHTMCPHPTSTLVHFTLPCGMPCKRAAACSAACCTRHHTQTRCQRAGPRVPDRISSKECLSQRYACASHHLPYHTALCVHTTHLLQLQGKRIMRCATPPLISNARLHNQIASIGSRVLL
jgi:hypothetical protein